MRARGSSGGTSGKAVRTGDGYALVLVEAAAGYTGTPHEHNHPEISYVLGGTVEHQGVPMTAGDGYIASAGSTHTGFTVTSDATYVLAFKL